jgi:transcriptional repressor NrdR
MICPKCKNENTQVVDSRDIDPRSIRRRRECERCKFRFTTFERIEPVRLVVVKRDGSTEPFNRDKIIRGIQIASNGRIDEEKILDIVDEIEQKLIESRDSSVTSRKIGNMVINRLKKLDEISYLRFTSVYKNFKDIESFEEELVKLKK